MAERLIDRIARRVLREDEKTPVKIDKATASPLGRGKTTTGIIDIRDRGKMDFGIIDVSRGLQTVRFNRVFSSLPVVTANYAEVRNGFFTLPQNKVSLTNVRRITLPKLTKFEEFLDRNALKVWGDVWFADIIKGCNQLGIPAWFCNPFASIARFFGNQFFLLYYSGTGDFDVIAKAISGKMYNDLQKRIDDLVFGKNGINSTIRGVETEINGILDELSSRINTMPNQIMETLGYSQDVRKQYSLPLPVTIRNITSSGFEVDVPQSGKLLYIAIATR